jgi:MFS family permease
MILIFTMAQGLGPWYAAFMIRSHGMGTAELGVSMGIVWGLSGLGGLLAGAYIVSRWFADDERGQLLMAALSAILTVPCFVAFLTLSDGYLALSALIPESLLLSLFLSPISAFIQRLVPDAMRATVFAVVMLLANLIGMGVGPQLVGILSDLLTPTLGSDGLRYAMLTVSLLVAWAAYHLIKAAQTIKEDLRAHGTEFGPNEGHHRELDSQAAVST